MSPLFRPFLCGPKMEVGVTGGVIGVLAGGDLLNGLSIQGQTSPLITPGWTGRRLLGGMMEVSEGSSRPGVTESAMVNRGLVAVQLRFTGTRIAAARRSDWAASAVRGKTVDHASRLSPRPRGLAPRTLAPRGRRAMGAGA
jgi:hypothetical protein